MRQVIRTAAIVVAMAALAGCGNQATQVPSDQGLGTPADATTDTGASGGVGSVATGTDVGTTPDLVPGMEPDAGTGGSAVQPPVVGTDAGTDVGSDGGTDVGPDVGSGVGTDIGTVGGGGGGAAVPVAPTESPFFYMIELMRANLGELDLAAMADATSTDGNVRGFASMMLTAHAAAGDRASAVARAQGIPVPSERSSEAAMAYERLSSLRDDAFDEGWVRAMVALHRDAVALNERQAAAGTSPAIRELAAELLPDLREHLARAEELAQDLDVDLSIGVDGRPLAESAMDGQNTAGS